MTNLTVAFRNFANAPKNGTAAINFWKDCKDQVHVICSTSKGLTTDVSSVALQNLRRLNHPHTSTNAHNLYKIINHTFT